MILCCGEALIDMIPSPTAAGPEGYVPYSGGAVFNTAIALGRLGARAGMLTGISSDLFGQQLRSALTASHVDVSNLIATERHTTLAFVRLNAGHASYTFFDENSAGRMLTPADMPDLNDDVTALFFGGISLVCEPCAGAYAALLVKEGAGRAVMIDPNIRPSFVTDEDRYRARLNAMIAASDIVKVSDEDLNWIDPRPVPLRQKIETVLAGGPALVIVTRGGEGAVGILRSGAEVTVPARRVTVVDTVGAGDTFNAGVMAKLAETGFLTKEAVRALPSSVLEDALDHGARAAAMTVSRAGANPPWAAEL